LSRVTLFLKGNLDLRDTLHSLRRGDGAVAWNGINEVMRAQRPGCTVRVRHETCVRSDTLLSVDGTIPPELSARGLDLGSRPLESQYSKAVFETDADAIVLSLQPDLMTTVFRHRRDGYFLYPEGWARWSKPDQEWMGEAFERVAPLEVGPAIAALTAVVARLQARTDAPILIYNISAAIPGDQVHVHAGLEDILSTRIRRFNLGLIELSQKTGVSVIDVDAVLARAGADRMKLDALHLNADGCRLVAEEVVRVLDDLGLFPEADG